MESPNSKHILESESEPESEYEVEAILSHKVKRDGSLSFLLLWKGYPESQATWQDEADLSCEHLVQEYFDKNDIDRTKLKQTRKAKSSIHAPKSKRQKKDESEPSNDITLPELSEAPSLVELDESMDWEELVSEVINLERNDNNELFVHLLLTDGHQTVCRSSLARVKCPQHLLDFYESHLSFRGGDDEKN